MQKFKTREEERKEVYKYMMEGDTIISIAQKMGRSETHISLLVSEALVLLDLGTYYPKKKRQMFDIHYAELTYDDLSPAEKRFYENIEEEAEDNLMAEVFKILLETKTIENYEHREISYID